MKHLEASIEIDASPEAVWAILTDFKRYPQWNPLITNLVGLPGQGESLQETVSLLGARPVKFKCRIIEFIPFQKLTWNGIYGASFLFNGQHEFILEATTDGTRFIQRETFTGLLIPFVKVETYLPGYHQMNEALKARAEG